MGPAESLAKPRRRESTRRRRWLATVEAGHRSFSVRSGSDRNGSVARGSATCRADPIYAPAAAARGPSHREEDNTAMCAELLVVLLLCSKYCSLPIEQILIKPKFATEGLCPQGVYDYVQSFVPVQKWLLSTQEVRTRSIMIILALDTDDLIRILLLKEPEKGSGKCE